MRPQSRVSVAAVHHFQVHADRIVMKTSLKYDVRGPKQQQLHVDLGDWEAESVGPEHLVDVERTRLGRKGPLVIHLREPFGGEFELTLLAHE